MICHHNQQCINTIKVSASMGSSGTTSWSSRSEISQNKHLVLSWSRIPQDVFGTHGPSVSHICINAKMTPSDPLLQSSPMALYLAWSSGRTSDPPKLPLPSDYYARINPNFADLNEFWRFKWFKQFFRYLSMPLWG